MLDRHLNSHYRATEYINLLRAENQGIASGPMSNYCKVAVNIPAFHQEHRVDKTIAKYAKQVQEGFPSSAFEVSVLVNGPSEVDLSSAPAYSSSLAAQKEHPNLHVNVFTLNYSPERMRIGLIRGDLASLTLIRAANAYVDFSRLAILTHDADLISLPNDYLPRISSAFASNLNLAALTGPVKYPKAGLASDDLVLSTQRFHDFYETILRYETGHFVLRGGNTAFRADGYIDAGGHGKSRISENKSLLKAMMEKDPASVAYDRHLWIKTSPRRQLVAAATGQLISLRHSTFGKKGDLAEHYQKPYEEMGKMGHSHDVSSHNFRDVLQAEIQATYLYAIITASRRILGFRALNTDHSTATAPTKPLDVNNLFERASNAAPNDIQVIQERIRRAGFFLGVKLCFQDTQVTISGMNKLKHGVLEKYRGV